MVDVVKNKNEDSKAVARVMEMVTASRWHRPCK